MTQSYHYLIELLYDIMNLISKALSDIKFEFRKQTFFRFNKCNERINTSHLKLHCASSKECSQFSIQNSTQCTRQRKLCLQLTQLIYISFWKQINNGILLFEFDQCNERSKSAQ